MCSTKGATRDCGIVSSDGKMKGQRASLHCDNGFVRVWSVWVVVILETLLGVRHSFYTCFKQQTRCRAMMNLQPLGTLTAWSQIGGKLMILGPRMNLTLGLYLESR